MATTSPALPPPLDKQNPYQFHGAPGKGRVSVRRLGVFDLSMALSARLQLRQSQALVMTPQLLQSIRLLQFTQAELERFVEEEIERNPLLERAEAREETVEVELADPGEDADWFSDAERPMSAEAIADKLDSSLENIFPDDPGTA